VLDKSKPVMHALHMTNKLDTPRKVEKGMSRSERENAKQFAKEFVPVVVLYTASISITTRMGHGTTAKQWLAVLLPMIPVLLGVWIIRRHILRLDEYAQIQTYKAIAVSFALSMVACVFCSLIAFADLNLSPMLVFAPFLVGTSIWGVLSCVFLNR
jgi:hypothetical protein